MAVQTTTNRITYTGNGTTTAFAYNFRILAAAHLKVYVAGALKVNGTDYTLSGIGASNGGTVTFFAAPANAAAVVFVRDVPITQLITTENNETVFSQVFDDAIDKLTMIAQQLSSSTGRSIYLADNDPTTGSMVLPLLAARANKYLRFDANGSPTAVDSQIGEQYYGALTADPSLRPDGSARQTGDLYYNSSTGFFRVFNGAGWANAIPPAALSLINYAETAATAKTTFTITGGYTAGTVLIYLNGVLLQPSEFTASNGTTVVLATACAIGDDFRCVGFSAFSVADTLARTSNLSDLPNPSTARTNLGLAALATLNAVGTAQITDSNVTTAKIADLAITTPKLADAVVSAAKLNGAQSGNAPIYAARAWVNFNGTGTVSIRASANVSSITDNGTGQYVVNLTTAMADANYAIIATAGTVATSSAYLDANVKGTPTANSVGINTVIQNSGNPTYYDVDYVYVVVMR